MLRNSAYWLASLLVALAVLGGCNAFGTGDSTLPGNTPNVAAQTSFRMVGDLGTPFVATVSDQRSSWEIRGVVPLNVIIANNVNPARIVATKLTNDNQLLAIEVISGFGVANISSTFSNYGVVVGSVNGKLKAFAPPASVDARFYINGPANAVFNATVEDESNAFVLQSRAPCVILYDSPNGNSTTGRVDGLFNLIGGAGGPLTIDLVFNGNVVQAVGGSTGGTVTVKVN